MTEIRHLFISILVLYLQLSCLPPVVRGQCSQCTTPPLADCKESDPAPADGGPPCLCPYTGGNNNPFTKNGCILKPCAGLSELEICDISGGDGGIQRPFSYKYRCTGSGGQCESCEISPPDCTAESLKNPPAYGGPPCSCAALNHAPGCTMKPCRVEDNHVPVMCICQPGVPVLICFNSNCPGNSKDTPDNTTTTTETDPTSTGVTDTSSPDSSSDNSSAVDMFAMSILSVLILSTFTFLC